MDIRVDECVSLEARPALNDAHVSKKCQEVEKHRLDTVVYVATSSLTIARCSTASVSYVRLVEPESKEPVSDVILRDPLHIVVGHSAYR